MCTISSEGAPSLRLRSGQALAFFARVGEGIYRENREVEVCDTHPSQKHAKDGAPPVLVALSEIKSWATRLAVFDAARGTDTAPIWRDRMTDGLNSPKVELVHELRTKVETAGKNP